jgi:hypothetical protein
VFSKKDALTRLSLADTQVNTSVELNDDDRCEHSYQGIKLTQQLQLNSELENQMLRTGPMPSRVPSVKRPVVPSGLALNITQYSDAREVMQWLQHKGFTDR